MRRWVGILRNTATSDVAAALLLSVSAVSGVSLDGVVRDHFHEGEYVGLVAHLLAYFHGETGFPLVIHGAMDYVPSLIAYAMRGDDRLIVTTRALNTLISAVNLFLLLLMINVVTKRSGWPRASRLLLMISVPIVLFVPTADAVQLHQRPLNPRDLFVVSFLAVLLAYERQAQLSRRMLLAALLGIVGACAPFWSYDRGLVVFAALTLAGVSLAALRRYADATVLFAACVLTLAMAHATRIGGTLPEYWHNLSYWLRNAGAWTSPVATDSQGIAIVFLACTAAVSAALLHCATREWRCGNHVFAVFVATLLLFEVALLRVGLTRGDLPHLFFSFWLSGFCVVVVLGRVYRPVIAVRLAARPSGWSDRVGPFVLLPLMFLCWQSAGPLPKQLTLREMANSIPRALFYGRSDDQLIDDTGFLEAMAVMKTLAPRCMLAWSNTGTVAAFARTPACGDVLYPVYVRGSEEPAYLSKLRADPPSAVIYNPSFWAHRVDGIAMEDRLPGVAALLRTQYVVKARFGDWIVLEHARPTVG